MRTLAEHTQALSAYFPGGRMFAARSKTTSNLYKLLVGLSSEMLTADELIKTYREQIIPSLTTDLLLEWESAVGIPDDCFKSTGDTDERRRDVLIKLASLGIQTVADFEAIALLFGVTLEVVPGIEENGTGDADDRFRIYIRHRELPVDTFPLVFPIQFGSSTLSVISCLFDKLRPANCEVIFKELGWDLTQGSYASKLFSVNTQEDNPQSIQFKPDGLSMYVLGLNNDTVYQYTLGTAWDVDTASYDTKSFSVASEDVSPTGMHFKEDGTKLFIIGNSSDTVYQYTLSTAWDVSTASYDTKSFLVSAQDTSPQGILIAPDGMTLYMVGDTTNSIYQYIMTSPWDISTTTVVGVKTISVAGQDLTPTGLQFKPDGTKVYMVGNINDTVYEYDLSTAWDITTAVYNSSSLDASTQVGIATGLFVKQDDGTKVYVLDNTTDTVYQYKVD